VNEVTFGAFAGPGHVNGTRAGHEYGTKRSRLRDKTEGVPLKIWMG